MRVKDRQEVVLQFELAIELVEVLECAKLAVKLDAPSRSLLRRMRVHQLRM